MIFLSNISLCSNILAAANPSCGGQPVGPMWRHFLQNIWSYLVNNALLIAILII